MVAGRASGLCGVFLGHTGIIRLLSRATPRMAGDGEPSFEAGLESRVSDNHLDRDVLNTLQDIMEDEYPVLLDTFVTDSEERLRLLQDAQQDLSLIHI